MTVLATRAAPAKDRRGILKQEMVLIPAGDFIMGWTGKAGDSASCPNPLRVAHTGAFWIDRYQTTNAMFLEFVQASGYRPNDSREFLKHWPDGHPMTGTEDQPVRFVSYEDAVAFAEWAGKRLVTSMEWEKAARGTDGRIYPWGNEEDEARIVRVYETEDPYDKISDADAYPDGESPYGVYGMASNVFEWTRDGAACDPLSLRIVRVKFPPPETYAFDSWIRHPNLGFRCAKDASPEEAARNR